MDNTRLLRISKYLSKHLRHDPQRLGLQLAPGGWVAVDELLAACHRHRFPLTRTELDEVVSRNDKQRFALDPTGTLIRANQGHTADVELDFEESVPTYILYHGTAEKSIAVILRTGLAKRERHHVHLTHDLETAWKVGKRRGKPAVFAVDAAAMKRAGVTFYRSANGVWLVDHVPPNYLQPLGDVRP